MAKAPPEAPATYYLLSDETWALIVEEYANGATAKELGAKWRVGPNSVYRHASAAGLTKRECSDGRARAHAEAVMEATRARDAGQGPEAIEPALTTLFVPAPEEDPDAGDPRGAGETGDPRLGPGDEGAAVGRGQGSGRAGGGLCAAERTGHRGGRPSRADPAG